MMKRMTMTLLNYVWCTNSAWFHTNVLLLAVFQYCGWLGQTVAYIALCLVRTLY